MEKQGKTPDEERKTKRDSRRELNTKRSTQEMV
jgi:hypothetical protein